MIRLNKFIIFFLTFSLVSSLVSAGFWDSITGEVTADIEFCWAIYSKGDFNIGIFVEKNEISKSECEGLYAGNKDNIELNICANSGNVENVVIKWGSDVIDSFTLDCTSTCVDTDGGKDYNVKGKVTSSSSYQDLIQEDYCSDSNNVVEFYCGSDKSLEGEIYACPGSCQNGVCIGTAPAEPSVNHAPVANDITASTNENTEAIITLSYSDSDANDQAVSCSVTNVIRGSITQTCSCSSGTCTIGLTPSQDSTADITASYRVNDGDDDSNLASITVTVNPAGTTAPTQCTNGCLKDSTCLPFGTRLIVEGTAKYCAINGNIIGQKDDSAECQNNYECKANQCTNDKCGTPEAEEPEDIECNGCLKDSTCLSFGTRIVEDDVPKYCDIAKEFIAQKEKEELCQNNYECKTNQCDDGVCGSLREELEETRTLLQGIIDWIRRVFGIEIGG